MTVAPTCSAPVGTDICFAIDESGSICNNQCQIGVDKCCQNFVDALKFWQHLSPKLSWHRLSQMLPDSSMAKQMSVPVGARQLGAGVGEVVGIDVGRGVGVRVGPGVGSGVGRGAGAAVGPGDGRAVAEVSQ